MPAQARESLDTGPGPVRKVRGPSIEERSFLLGKRRSSLSWGLGASIFAHLAMFGGAWVYASYSPPRLEREKPIVAKLVRLGKPRDEKLLPRLPTKAKPPPPPPKSKPAPVPVAKPPPPTPAPSPTAKAAPVPKPAPKPDPAAQAAARREQMMAALAKVEQTTGPTTDVAEELPGQADGDAMGTAEDAAEGDRYLALVEQAIRSNYVLPTTISAKERLYLACVLYLRIAASGSVDSFKIIETSGNAVFDRAVEASVRQTKLPPPPEAFRRAYGDGLEIRFKP